MTLQILWSQRLNNIRKRGGNDTLVYALFYVEEADTEAVVKEIKETLNLASVLV